jgi:hypothetical protein
MALEATKDTASSIAALKANHMAVAVAGQIQVVKRLLFVLSELYVH